MHYERAVFAWLCLQNLGFGGIGTQLEAMTMANNVPHVWVKELCVARDMEV